MRRIVLTLLLITIFITLAACNRNSVDFNEFTVTFNSNGGSEVEPQTVKDGRTAFKPDSPEREGFIFIMWYLIDDSEEFDFSTPITEDITVNAFWQVVIPGKTNEDYIDEDIEWFQENLRVSPFELAFTSRGGVNRSEVEWETDAEYISDNGIILPLEENSPFMTEEVIGHFTYNGTEKSFIFDIELLPISDTVITNSVNYSFENLTNEYDVNDGTVELFFEDNGAVPYINLIDFFNLVEGFIDPNIEFNAESIEGVLTVEYEYYDEIDDEVHQLVLEVDSIENTIVVNDPAFYWAYAFTTETNFGRHIQYDFDNPNASFDEGNPVVYDLDDYSMDIVEYNNQLLIPFSITNQLFAGSSYYNVYFNGDQLYGIYSLPVQGTDEFETLRTSSKNGEDMPVDLSVHTFNMLAFILDNLYGLKDVREIDSYYPLLRQYIDDFLSLNPEEFDEGLSRFLLQEIDEPHTTYGNQSYYNELSYNGPSVTSLADYGPRFIDWYNNGLSATDDVIAEKFGVDFTDWSVSNKPDYWFVDDHVVMLSLNEFVTADVYLDTSFNPVLVHEILNIDEENQIIPTVGQGSKYWYFNSSTEENDIFELLVKDVNENYKFTYEASLVADGYIYEQDNTSEPEKDNGYFTKNINGVDYMVQVAYNHTYNILYLSVTKEVPEQYTDEWVHIADPESIIYYDSAIYMELTLEQILLEDNELTDIILDITFNTGGNIGALYRVVGFITDQPFEVSRIDGDTDGTSTYYVDIDDNIPSYENLNWSLLTSQATFSAANELAVLFQVNNLGNIIGLNTGGGASSITPVLLPNGSAFTMSSNNIGAYRTGTGTVEDPYVYNHTEFGVLPDFIIPVTDLYDEEELLAILYPGIQ